MSGAGINGEGDAWYEWLLSDHPGAQAERTRRREAHRQGEVQRAAEIQAWVAKIDATPEASEALRRLAGSLGPSVAKSRARAEAATTEPDETWVARERGHWETYMQVSAPHGSWDYRYPARYTGAEAASQPVPAAVAELEAARDEPEISS